MTNRGTGRTDDVRFAAMPMTGAWPELAPRPEAPAAAALVTGGERLRLPGALAVTTGQQPGLFGGPMYVVHKALAARALARCLEQRWQRPVVPVFWLAGDDHDWAEATRTAWWTAGGEVVEWALQPRASDAPQRAMAAEPLPADVAAARDRLADDLPPGESRDAALDWIDRHWRAGATIHSAFASAITELFAPLGIATLDASAAPLKQVQQPWIRAALEHSDAIDAALAALPVREEWVGAGQRQTLVFLDAAEGRDRLIRDGDQFRTRRSGERFTEAELYQLLDREPGRFSAGVLLRPVIEAAVLPTVAYVAGPGELRYLTRQASAVYPVLGVTPQAPVPRWGGAVVDAVATRLLGRLQLDAASVLHDDGRIGREVLRRDLPATIPEALEDLRAAIDDVSARLAAEGERIDPVLERAVESRRRKLQFVRTDLEQLMLRHHRKRDDVAWAQYRRLRARLMPLDRPQERTIGVAAALGRWGGAWLEAASESAGEWAATMPTDEPAAAAR